ncbi:MAG: hypothetical protein AAB471_01620 [Patescibacteria group bacterium]
MSKTTFTILVSLLIIAIVGGAIWFFYFYQGGQKQFDFGVTIKDFLPFGRLAEPDQTRDSAGKEGQETPDKISYGVLRQLAIGPVAGFTSMKGTTTVTARYLERHTGHIYDIGVLDQKPKRVSGTTIPRVYEALFVDSGKSVLIRYLGDDNATIETYLATVPKIPESGAEVGLPAATSVAQAGEPAVSANAGQAGELTGVFLPQNISDISTSPNGKSFFYILSSAGGAVGIVGVPGGGTGRQIFSFPFSEWLSSWTNEKTITLTTKPSGGIAGYAYALNPIDKSFVKIFGNVAGLTTLLSPDRKYMLYGSSGETGMLSAIYDLKNKSFKTLSVSTLPEKCAWAKTSDKIYCGVPAEFPFGKYPDVWYKGQASFSDSLWSIDPASTISEVVSDLAIPDGTQFDVIKPALSADGKYLLFINKKDLSLWSYDLGSI